MVHENKIDLLKSRVQKYGETRHNYDNNFENNSAPDKIIWSCKWKTWNGRRIISVEFPKFHLDSNAIKFQGKINFSSDDV